MGVTKTYAEINEKIRTGKVVVVTAEEIIGMVQEKGVAAVTEEVDVVTTGTFGPMCSSGAYFNFGHPKPRIKMHRVWMNGVPAYTPKIWPRRAAPGELVQWPRSRGL